MATVGNSPKIRWLVDPVPQSNRLGHSVQYYNCAKFQVIAIRGFRFIVLTHPPSHTHTYRHVVTK